MTGISTNRPLLVFFDSWVDSVAETMLRDRDDLELVKLDYATPETRNWQIMAGAHGYQEIGRAHV